MGTKHRQEDWRRIARCFIGRFERQRHIRGLADRDRENEINNKKRIVSEN